MVFPKKTTEKGHLYNRPIRSSIAPVFFVLLLIQMTPQSVNSLSFSLSQHCLKHLILFNILQADLYSCWALKMTFTQNLEKRPMS